jgi:RNA polymerase sigma factor (sigma-70 family)
VEIGGALHPSSVPETFDQLIEQYQPFVLWAIRRVSRGQVRPDDLDDLKQQVYLRCHEKDYLARCRTLIAARGTGQFSTYLYFLVRSVCINQFIKNTRSPLSRSVRAVDSRGRDDEDPGAVNLEVLYCDEGFEDRMCQQDALERFADFISTTKKGAVLVRTLQMMYEGYTVPEAAQLIGVTRASVSTCRRNLRPLMQQFLAS